jgi:hypothetical protein
MKKIISFLINIDEQNIKNYSLKTIIIDLLTIGIGTVILLTSVSNLNSNQDGVTIGSSLLVFGVLIKIWKKELKKE